MINNKIYIIFIIKISNYINNNIKNYKYYFFYIYIYI